MKIPSLHTEITGSPYAIPHADAYGHRVAATDGKVLPHAAPPTQNEKQIIGLPALQQVTVSLTAHDPAKSLIDGYAKAAAGAGPVRLNLRRATQDSFHVDLSSSESDSAHSTAPNSPRSLPAPQSAAVQKAVVERIAALSLHDSANSLFGASSMKAASTELPVRLNLRVDDSIHHDIQNAVKAQQQYAVIFNPTKSPDVRRAAQLLADHYDSKLSDRTKRYNEIRHDLLTPGQSKNAAAQREASNIYGTPAGQLKNIPVSAHHMPLEAPIRASASVATGKTKIPAPPANQTANALPGDLGERGAYLTSMAKTVATPMDLATLKTIAIFRQTNYKVPLGALVRHAEEIVHTGVQRTLPPDKRTPLPPVSDANARKAALTSTLRRWESLPGSASKSQ